MSNVPTICCVFLQNKLELAGEKGTSIFACREGSRRKFIAQARPFEPDVVEKHCASGTWPDLRDSRGHQVPFVIAMDMPLRYCPACGANLEEWIAGHTTQFDAMVRPDLRS